ncbi:MAG: TonB-dependent receptor family protein [Verrucomicrobiales bacterium]
MPYPLRLFQLCLLAITILATSRSAVAQVAVDDQAPSAEAAPARAVVLDTVRVVGSAQGAFESLGSASFLDEKDIDLLSSTDINQVLRRVPGVYIREEDGYGNFPNISLRGVTTVRNTQITVMEDGVLSAPAPYSDPAAYYTPALGRMSGLEVLKASSQVKYGPQVSGGVINYISTPIPTEATFYSKNYFGSHQELYSHTYWGDTFETGIGQVGVLFELFYHSSDGFKTIDAAPGVQRDRTGFERIEPMIKLQWTPSTDFYQHFEFKFGYTDFTADETYLGLTESDFRSNPFRRYASTRFDRIPTEQYRTHLRHVIEPTEGLLITTTGYYNYFERNWFKLQAAALPGGDKQSLSEILAGEHGPELLGVLQGRSAGSFTNRANSRSYESYGVDQVFSYDFQLGEAAHTLEGGWRLHWDGSTRFQNETTFTQDASGRIVDTVVGAPGSQDDRSAYTRALALWLQDTVRVGSWTFVPGMRYEYVWQSFTNSRSGTSGRGTQDVFGGGLGIGYDWSDTTTSFLSAYRGFSIPGPNSALNDDLGPETSWAFELGSRYDNQAGFSAEGIVFASFYQDLIVDSNIGGGGGGATENAGDVDVYGLELAVNYDPGHIHNWGFRMPNRLAFTYTDARFANSSSADGSEAESIFAGAISGNRLPYIPEYQLTVGTGIEYDKLGVYLVASYVPSTFATGSNTSAQIRPDGVRDARFGTTDAFFVIDLEAKYQVNENFEIFAGIRNLTGDEYVSSRIPEGPRPGSPRLFHVGGTIRF